VRPDRIAFLKLLDRILGKVAASLFLPSRNSKRVPSTLKQVLFIRPGGIGDAVLLLPAISELKKVYPGAVVDVLAEKRNGSVFSLSPDVARIWRYDNPTELFMVIRNVYDVVIDAEQWHRLSAIVAKMTQAPLSVGYATNERGNLFTHAIPYLQDDYEADSFLHLVEPLTGKLSIDIREPFLVIPGDLTKKVQKLLTMISAKKIVALFPGGSIRERRWGNNRFHLVARDLEKQGYAVIIIGDSSDREAGSEIAADLQNVIDFCGRLSLVETAAVLKESSLLITGDSGMMHIGFGVGIKTLSLFGPGIEKKWAPRGPAHVVMNKHLPCSPCTKFGYTPRCKINAECMKRISADEVLEKALEMLEG